MQPAGLVPLQQGRRGHAGQRLVDRAHGGCGSRKAVDPRRQQRPDLLPQRPQLRRALVAQTGVRRREVALGQPLRRGRGRAEQLEELTSRQSHGAVGEVQGEVLLGTRRRRQGAVRGLGVHGLHHGCHGTPCDLP